MDRREDPARSFDRESDAEYVTTVEAEALAGVFVNRSDRTTVAEYARFWAAARPHRPTTARRRRTHQLAPTPRATAGDRGPH